MEGDNALRVRRPLARHLMRGSLLAELGCRWHERSAEGADKNLNNRNKVVTLARVWTLLAFLWTMVVGVAKLQSRKHALQSQGNYS